jgi:hypothetical protein
MAISFCAVHNAIYKPCLLSMASVMAVAYVAGGWEKVFCNSTLLLNVVGLALE